ncbi:MaoC family dehydratase [Arenibaculum sp.]|jgi:2-methylfumaryl-CoA hydratase|uniref:MaoC family dehydratase n=1 Tax=Arenibaculum sp. TaxID=2865862 RepID=UPI002E127C25|nr:MaoC family dehydratase [Arenibaculum sp.]
MTRSSAGRLFEDFTPGLVLGHPVPRTVTTGDVALHLALTGSRNALHASDPLARGLGLPAAPVDDLLVFHLVFGRSVADVSLNAVANLGYADCRFLDPVFPGDTLSATSAVIGAKRNSNRSTGTVWVRTTGTNQHGRAVLEFVRWVMLPVRDPAAPAPAPDPVVPVLPDAVAVPRLVVPPGLSFAGLDPGSAGIRHFWEDYAPGERIDHIDGTTVEEAEHALATRLYQNPARVHFDARAAREGRFGRRLVYGGHVISIARALSWNGLEGALRMAAIHGGRHAAPCFAGDTVYAWTEVLSVDPVPGRTDLGALRLATRAVRDRPCADFPADGPDLLLALDYTVLAARRMQ